MLWNVSFSIQEPDAEVDEPPPGIRTITGFKLELSERAQMLSFKQSSLILWPNLFISSNVAIPCCEAILMLLCPIEEVVVTAGQSLQAISVSIHR